MGDFEKPFTSRNSEMVTHLLVVHHASVYPEMKVGGGRLEIFFYLESRTDNTCYQVYGHKCKPRNNSGTQNFIKKDNEKPKRQE